MKPEFRPKFSVRNGLVAVVLSTIGLLSFTAGSPAYSQSPNIKNDVFRDTKDGKPIFSQGGGIFRFRDPKTNTEKFYWYGVEYQEAVKYREDPSVTYTRGNRFNAVTCHTSTDLVNWESEGEALTREEALKNGGPRAWPWIARLGVAHFKDAGKYVMVAQYGAGILFAVADKPAGPFKWHHRKDMTETIGTPNTGDQTVFTDEDTGKSYLVYSYGKGRNKIYISEIGLKGDKYDLLDCTQVYKGSGREGNCMFKYKGKFYLAASNLYGWDSSYAYYLVADDVRGPYLPENDMMIMKGAEDDYAHVTQTGFFVTVKGTQQDTVIYCGDRWAAFAGNGLGYNQWCPLSFDGDQPYFNSLHSWDLHVPTGRWRVADDNNWIKNASFEADRKDVPSGDKPKQERLMGWETKVTKGTKISLERGSPMLNHANSSEDRKQVIGERCLNMSDSTDFTRQVHQVIASSPYVKFEDGEYTMTAKVMNSDGFGKLEMYARSGGKEFSTAIKGENSRWATIELKEVRVSGNKVEVGFLAEGKGGSFCRVDDVSFVKSE
ncbi:MAG: family 43 glycosylhydrolase [Verrucomicrobia bacterium]|nr:family 43 glycosylhydrolase [Verrucomicrobiota bacterium]